MKTYLVKDSLRHDQVLYIDGDTVEMGESAAAPLLESGVIVELEEGEVGNEQDGQGAEGNTSAPGPDGSGTGNTPEGEGQGEAEGQGEGQEEGEGDHEIEDAFPTDEELALMKAPALLAYAAEHFPGVEIDPKAKEKNIRAEVKALIVQAKAQLEADQQPGSPQE